MLNTRSSTRILLARALTLTLTSALASALAAASAQAIPYFNGPLDGLGRETGFDNSSLQLPADEVISLGIDFSQYPVESGNTSNTLGLLADDVINEIQGEDMDRLVTWTLINNDPQVLKGFVIFLPFLASPPDYSSAAFDVRLDEVDPMVITSYGPFFFAGFRLTPGDFTDVGGRLQATRTFRYTADTNQFLTEAPALAVAYAPDSELVPEPATGLLLTGALLVAVGAGRKRTR
jgi:hypothetical protein